MGRARRIALGLAVAGLAVGLGGCKRRKPPIDPGAFATHPASTEQVTSDAIGLGKLNAAIARAQPVKTSRDTSGAKRKLAPGMFIDLLQHEGKLLAVQVGERSGPNPVVVVSEDGTLETIGEAGDQPRLVGVPGGVAVGSGDGLSLIRPGKPQQVLYEGRVVAPIRAGKSLVWAACPEGEPCKLKRTGVGGGEVEAIDDELPLPVVNDLAFFEGAIFVAGRYKDPREGVPLAPHEIRAQMAYLQHGGPLPASARFARGYLTRVDLVSGKVQQELLQHHRPLELEAGPSGVYVLTEGTLARGMSDAVVFRMKTVYGGWEVLVTGIEMGGDLSLDGDGLCWTAMPKDEYLVECLDPSSRTRRTLVAEDWTVVDAVRSGDRLLWLSLKDGLWETRVP